MFSYIQSVIYVIVQLKTYRNIQKQLPDQPKTFPTTVRLKLASFES